MISRRTGAALAGAAVLLAGVTACDSKSNNNKQSTASSSSTRAPSTVAAKVSGTEIGKTGFTVTGSVQQVLVSGAQPGQELALVDADDHAAGRSAVDQSDEFFGIGTVDSSGNLIFRIVPPGDGYEVRAAKGSEEYLVSDTITVGVPEDGEDASFYSDQKLIDGYQYITTRDGTTVAANVILPGPVEEGPWPTVIEYSGYDPANPDDPEPSTQIWSALGYAVVGVNMRGTGCSGGAFDLFDPPQMADGYDAVEAVAAQPWVMDHKVGMVGISYPGISQLYVAATQPPSLAAITPQSVTDDLYRGTGYPGGIFNNGFAQRWLTERVTQAAPGGQEWAKKRMDEGDQICIANQSMRSQNIDAYKLVQENQYIVPEWIDERTPWNFVSRIKVPVFLAGAWQDEQTGGHFPDMLGNFGEDIPMKITLTNGAHVDSLGPQILPRLFEFNEFYVAKRIPEQPAIVQMAGALLNEQFGGDIGTIPGDRFTGETNYDDALQKYEDEPRVRVLYENGFGEGSLLGAPQPAFETLYDAWPIPEVEPTTYFFGADGTLSDEKPDDEGDAVDSYVPDPTARPETNLGGTEDSDAWKVAPAWNWTPLVAGKALAYVSKPLREDTVMTGTGSVDLYVRSNVPDTDLQVTVSEVRPDGQEMYVQNGWLRASHRKLDEKNSTELAPRQTHLKKDAAPLPKGEFAPVRVEIFSFANVFHKGSRIRISIEAPGGDKPRWKFDTIAHDPKAKIEIGRSADYPSKVVLPFVPNVKIKRGVPPCPSLRGQPCRAYVELTNN